jgi:hypothetical protein
MKRPRGDPFEKAMGALVHCADKHQEQLALTEKLLIQKTNAKMKRELFSKTLVAFKNEMNVALRNTLSGDGTCFMRHDEFQRFLHKSPWPQDTHQVFAVNFVHGKRNADENTLRTMTVTADVKRRHNDTLKLKLYIDGNDWKDDDCIDICIAFVLHCAGHEPNALQFSLAQKLEIKNDLIRCIQTLTRHLLEALRAEMSPVCTYVDIDFVFEELKHFLQ